MANIFVDHKDRWLALAESDSDFAVQFIRAWIPFNAWYCNAYPHHDNRDAPILNEMKGDNNLFRTRIIALLSGSDAEALQFKSYLGQLHITLERFFMPSSDSRITFTELKYRLNPVRIYPSIPNPVRRMNYKAEIMANNHVQAMIVEVGTSATKFTYTHTKYDLQHFLAYGPYAGLSLERQSILLNCFKEVNPKKAENLITADRRNSIECASVYFINDPTLLSQAIIELLYRLRCILFHGEIQPSRDNLSVYEPAYYMLRLLLKSLK